MSKDELQELANDIEKNGLRHKVVLYVDKEAARVFRSRWS